MTASKSGNHIVVTGTGNTLASITSDINDTSFIEKTGTAPDVYTVKGNVDRYLYINNTGVLTIGDPEDFSKNETLQFDQSVASKNRLYINAGGHLKMYGDTTIDFSSHATNRAYYTYLYGAVTVQGNDTYKPVWQNYRRLYLYESQNNNTYTGDVWTFDNMIFGSADLINEYCLYVQGMGKVRPHSFTNITWDKSYGRNLAMYPLYVPYGINGFEAVTFENINFANVGNYSVYLNNASSQEFGHCVFGTATSWKVYVVGCYRNDSTQRYYSYDYLSPEVYGQDFVWIHNSTFDSTGTAGVVYVHHGGTLLLSDCEFQHTAGDSIQVQYQGTVMIWDNITFTGGREVYDLDYAGCIQRVHALDLTVQDKFGNPIEDAKVGITQSEGKESFLFRTNSSGKLINHFSINKALLTHQHQYGNNKTTNAVYWSDASNSTYHKVTVFKIGYKPKTFNVVMSEDRAQTVTLRDLNNFRVEM